MQVLDAYALDAYALDAHTLDIEGDAVCACPRGPICSKGKRERGKEKKKKEEEEMQSFVVLVARACSGDGRSSVSFFASPPG